jgi:uncharacterized protein YndB with AHSA1/START domain
MKTVGSLQLTTPSDRELRFVREFDAPRTLVFDAHTKPELIRRWLIGMPGWTLSECTFDARVGGAYRYAWKHEESGQSMGMGGVVREITAPARLVATEKYDEAWYPGEALDTTEFAEKAGKTTLTLTVMYESKAARDAVLATDAAEGMDFSYGQLAALLKALAG